MINNSKSTKTEKVAQTFPAHKGDVVELHEFLAGYSACFSGMDEKPPFPFTETEIIEFSDMLERNIAAVSLALDKPFFAIFPYTSVNPAVAGIRFIADALVSGIFESVEDDFLEDIGVDFPEIRDGFTAPEFSASQLVENPGGFLSERAVFPVGPFSGTPPGPEGQMPEIKDGQKRYPDSTEERTRHHD